jgi:hypothetical protein
MTRLVRQQDVLGGLLLILLGACGLYFGASLEVGTAHRMGPGFFPMILSWLMIGLGVVVSAAGALRTREVATRVVWRPLLLVTVAVVAFWLLIDRLGLVAATAAVVVLGGFAGRDARPLELAALALFMAVATALLFVYALNLPLPLWGR